MAILMLYDHDGPSYKRGMVVQVFEDSQPTIEPPAEPFLFIKVPGAPVDDFETWATEPEWGPIPDPVTDPETGELVEFPPDMVARREYAFDLDSLPAEAQEALATSRVWTVQ